MKRKRIFMITQTDTSNEFGVGRYISEMVSEAKQHKDFYEMVVICVAAINISKLQIRRDHNVIYLNIPRPFTYKSPYVNGLSKEYSQSIFCILTDLFNFTSNDTFHFNSNIQCFLIKAIKENTCSKIIYTIHISLWKVLYQNNRSEFELQWTKANEKSTDIDRINREVKNCSFADTIICLTQDMANDIIKYYKVSSEKIKIIPNGISNKKEIQNNDILDLLQNELSIEKDSFVFLYIGRLNIQKGVMNLMEAYLSLEKKMNTPTSLLIIGTGPLKKTLEDVALARRGNVHFAGYVNPNSIDKYYALANAVVFPSSNEQSSYVMLEAMRNKLPLVVTDIPAFKVLEEDKFCLKCKLFKGEIDKNDLIQKMLILITNFGLCQKLTKNAYFLYKKKFTSDKMFNKTYY